MAGLGGDDSMRMWGLSLAAVGIVIAAACGGSGGGAATTGPGTGTGNNPGNNQNPNTVTLVDSSFNPANLTIKSGQTVTWQWNTCTDTTGGYGYGNGNPCIEHQIHFDDGSGIQSAVQNQGTFNHTFTAAGTFKYHCLIHGAYMSGQVVVQ
jgi:plastocyanin